MSQIIINGKFLTQRVTGVQRYARELLKELDIQMSVSEHIEIAVPPNVESMPVYKHIVVKKVGHLEGLLWEQISLPLYALRKGIIINLCNASPLLAPGIVAIHDVKIKARPQDFGKKFIIWYNLLFINATKRAKKIITVSDFSKNEIMKYYNVPAEKIDVIPDAWQHYDRLSFDENTLNKYKLIKDGYFFSVSSLEPNKNFKWIAEVARKNKDYTFAIAGSISKNVFKEGLGFECPENMKLLGYVSDEEAKTLMRDCKAFLFPSFYEGFGIPPLEAMSAGAKRVIVSDSEIMHEIFDDSVVYINPNIYELPLSNEDINSEKTAMNKYSWKKSAALLLNTIKSFNSI